MKDTHNCCKESKMKVKNEDNRAVAPEKDNQATFEKKNNLSGNMTKEEQTEKADNLEKEQAKNTTDEAIDNLTSQVKEIKISNGKEDKVSDIKISEQQKDTNTVQRQITVEEDGKRPRSQSESENDTGIQKSQDLKARGPNGGVARFSYDSSFNFNCSNQQPERKSFICNKRTYSEESEPHKYIRPVGEFNLPDMPQMMTIQNVDQFGGGTVNIKSPSPVIQQNEVINPFDFNDKLLDISGIVESAPYPNLGQEFTCNIDPMNNIPVNNTMYTQMIKEDNIMEEQSHSPYGGPPSNKSDATDSGVSGMSYGSPYQEMPSPQSVAHASPPHEFNCNMPEIQGNFQQPAQMNYMGCSNLSTKSDYFSGREKELEDAESVIFGELKKDSSKKSNKSMSDVPMSIAKQVMSSNLVLKQQQQQQQQFNQPMNHHPVSTMATQISMPQSATVFGQQPIQTKQIILPPTQPSAVVHPMPVNSIGNPVMIPQGCPIPVGPMPPYTQPQIIIIQQGPPQTMKKQGFRNIAPKTEKPVGKKPVPSPGENKDGVQKQIVRPETVPVMTVKPTPSQTPIYVTQRPPTNNMTSGQRNKKLNVARRMVAEIPSAQISQQDEEGDTYLHVAACRTDPDMVQAILERLNREKMDWLIDLENKKRMTPLYLAVLGNQPEIVEIFLNNGADPNSLAQSMSSDGKSMEVKAPIHVAAAGGEESLSTLKKLLSVRDISLNIYNSEGHTALHTAIIAHGTKRSSTGTHINSMNTIEALIKAGADPNSQDKKSGKTPLMYAIEKRDYLLIEKMLRLFDPKKLRNVVKSQTFDGSNCLKIAEGRKSEFDPQTWQKLWDLLNKACTGELPKTSLIIGAY